MDEEVVNDSVLVAPYVGAWIETLISNLGLQRAQVAPYVGAWIETIVRNPSLRYDCVAPYVGAWIETQRDIESTNLLRPSHPTWVRGLKPSSSYDWRFVCKVAPYVGAWIETLYIAQSLNQTVVAPYVGAWIETKNIVNGDMSRRSHPTWVRGLKLLDFTFENNNFLSHPTWVRGLKLLRRKQEHVVRVSHPTWVRGLKHLNIVRTFVTVICRTLRGCVD